jgi:hypothetical protein
VCWLHETLFAEALELFTLPVFQVIVLCKMVSSPSCWAEPLKFLVLTSLMSAHIVIILNQSINLVFGLHYHCFGWSAALGPVTNFLFTILKMRDLACNGAYICGILTIHAFQTSVNFYGTGAFCIVQFSYRSLPSMYVHNIRHFALLLLLNARDRLEH